MKNYNCAPPSLNQFSVSPPTPYTCTRRLYPYSKFQKSSELKIRADRITGKGIHRKQVINGSCRSDFRNARIIYSTYIHRFPFPHDTVCISFVMFSAINIYTRDTKVSTSFGYGTLWQQVVSASVYLFVDRPSTVYRRRASMTV